MKKVMIFILILFTKCFGGLHAQQVEIIKFDALQQILRSNNDTTYVINFWATWCKPCVHELPVFDTAFTKYANQPVKIILVSLDFKREYETRLVKFVNEHKTLPMVVLLDEPDYNKWIDKVAKEWGGAIPATIVFNNKNRFSYLHQDEITFNDLCTRIDEGLSK
jgi:thiol-disulfide isomerase/thioredoxin